MVVTDHRIVASSVVSNEECPAASWTGILVTAMEDIGMKE